MKDRTIGAAKPVHKHGYPGPHSSDRLLTSVDGDDDPGEPVGDGIGLFLGGRLHQDLH